MGKHVSQYSDIPRGDHFAIFTTGSIYVPGDERSRTNPGHGYPASREQFVQYEAFDSREEWESRVAYLTERSQPFSAAFVSPAKIKTTVAVSVETAST